MDEIKRQIIEKQAFVMGSEFCLQCALQKSTAGCVFVPLESVLEIEGQQFKHIAVFVCKECIQNVDLERISKTVLRSLLELNVNVL